MGIRESLLNTITSVSNSDFVRIVTSAGVSSKATLANVMKSFETGLGAKSSLTTSDYIRVVGSDDVSYKQSVSNVRTALGIGASASYSSLEAFYAEFSSMATNTKYFVTFYDACATALGLPSATYKGYVSKSTSTICDMTVQWYSASSGALSEYIGRVIFDGSGNVTETYWTTQPTRAEVDPYTNISTLGTADLNTWRLSGIYIQNVSANATTARHYPVAGTIGFLEVIAYPTDTERVMQRYTTIPSCDVYVRIRNYDGTWYNWVKEPTRAEIDAASKVVLAKEITQSTSASVTLTAGHVYLVCGGHPFEAGCAYVVAAWASGAARITPILANSHLSLSLNSLTLTASLNTNVTMWLRVLDLGANS